MNLECSYKLAVQSIQQKHLKVRLISGKDVEARPLFPIKYKLDFKVIKFLAILFNGNVVLKNEPNRAFPHYVALVELFQNCHVHYGSCHIFCGAGFRWIAGLFAYAQVRGLQNSCSEMLPQHSQQVLKSAFPVATTYTIKADLLNHSGVRGHSQEASSLLLSLQHHQQVVLSTTSHTADDHSRTIGGCWNHTVKIFQHPFSLPDSRWNSGAIFAVLACPWWPGQCQSTSYISHTFF